MINEETASKGASKSAIFDSLYSEVLFSTFESLFLFPSTFIDCVHHCEIISTLTSGSLSISLNLLNNSTESTTLHYVAKVRLI